MNSVHTFVMESLMGHQIRMPNIALSTEITAMRLGAPVYVQVTRQIAALDKTLLTSFAFKPLVLFRGREKKVKKITTKNNKKICFYLGRKRVDFFVPGKVA